MLEFRVLGPIELKGDGGGELDQVLAQPKRVALLAYLAITHRPQFRRRETIVGYLWPDLDEDHARGALRQGVHFLRRALGSGVVAGRGDDELGLDRTRLWCDATAFDQACDEGRLSEALDLYRGDLMDGFAASGVAPEFEQWLEAERDRLRRRAAEAARITAEQHTAAGELAAAANVTRRAVTLAPDDESVLRRLITVLDAVGNRAGAVRAYEDFAGRLAAEFAVEPSVETKALIEAVRARVQRGGALGPATADTMRLPLPAGTHRPLAPGATRSSEPSSRQVLQDRYVLEHAMGRSGVVSVYRARDLKHDRLVVLKVLSRSVAAVLGPERFVREIRLLAQLQHPGIVALYDSGVVDDAVYYVMPYLEAESLRDRLMRELRFTAAVAVSIACDIADALSSAHARGVVLRDLKPEGVLLAEGRAIVGDFGIARAMARLAGDRLTKTGVVLGTPAYMSPEQASGVAELDERSDVYSLGCVCFEMLTGEPPLRAATNAATISKLLTAAAPRVRSINAGVTQALDDVVHHALAKQPADRYPNAAAFATALRRTAAVAARS